RTHTSADDNRTTEGCERPKATGPTLSSQLEASLKVNHFNGNACAASGRFWEDLLERFRLPYLLLRVADMRMTLGSRTTALPLYEEVQSIKQVTQRPQLQTILQDPSLATWIQQTSSDIQSDLQRQLHAYNTVVVFTPSQHWRSTAQLDGRFPYCRLQRAQIDLLQNQWTNMCPPEVILARCLNLHCLETNAIEGIFQFDPSAITRLVLNGFYDLEVELIDERNIVRGVVRNCAHALSILRDTHEALNEMLTLVQWNDLDLTVETICRLHKTLMRTSRVLSIDAAHGHRLQHLNIGVTRQVSQVNVTATSQDQSIKIQFCPYDKVDAELATFCERFNVQMLASTPLLKKRLPLLCVPSFFKPGYLLQLNNIRANRDGDYQRLMTVLYDGTRASLDLLEAIN
ncbi:hypothetical protein Hypma_010278, partial [Hypsizygus marmoreus]